MSGAEPSPCIISQAEEFVSGCMQLHGPAKSLQLAQMSLELSQSVARLVPGPRDVCQPQHCLGNAWFEQNFYTKHLNFSCLWAVHQLQDNAGRGIEA